MLIGQKGDQSTAWATTGLKTATTTLSAAIAIGDQIYLGVFATATTVPTFQTQPTGSLNLVDGTSTNCRVALQTSFPFPLPALTTGNQTSQMIFVGMY